jgi:protein-S-isoprenylcysteine O-methyltransferase Ste14
MKFYDLTSFFIFICWAIFFAIWILAALSAKPTVETLSRGWSTGLIVIIIAMFLIANSNGWFSAYTGVLLWPQTLFTGLIADAVTLTGLLVMLWARRALGGNWSDKVAIKENHELIERGPYHYARHPIYSGFLLMILGVTIIDGHLGGLIVFAVCTAGFWFKALQEERLLTKHFPRAYPAYKARVKALIPFVL